MEFDESKIVRLPTIGQPLSIKTRKQGRTTNNPRMVVCYRRRSKNKGKMSEPTITTSALGDKIKMEE